MGVLGEVGCRQRTALPDRREDVRDGVGVLVQDAGAETYYVVPVANAARLDRFIERMQAAGIEVQRLQSEATVGNYWGSIPMVGYGGGRKSVIPGICALETIKQNHLHILGREVGSGTNPICASAVTDGNPLHEDMMEIAALARPDFLVNIVPNLAGEIAGVFAGNWASAWWKATRLVDHIFGVPIRERAETRRSSASHPN